MLRYDAISFYLGAFMLRMLTVLCLSVFTLVCSAAPKKLVAQYEVTRKGQPFATVTETFSQENGKYHIESTTKGIGAYALLGVRKLSSEGQITAEGLKPSHFELSQGDNEKKSLFTDFDWANNTLNMKVKNKMRTAPLEKGTQDLASYAYQWLIKPPSTENNSLFITTGKKVHAYQYKIIAKDVQIETAAGKFKTMHLAESSSTDADNTEDKKQLWLATEKQHIVVRLVLQDANGFTVEQNLTSLTVE